MELPKFVCGYKGGMNKDISPTDYPNTCYFDAINFRVITDSAEGLSTASMALPKGNLISFTLPTNMVMLGYTVLRNHLILLTTNSLGGDNPDRIYKIVLSDVISASDVSISNTYFHNGGNLVYKADLGFDVNYPIRVVGNYENADVQKIYWVDGLNTLKHLNTIHNTTYNNLTILDPQLLEILPNHTYGTYELEESVGGHLRAGRIQYSYQLYSISGTETMFAPPSGLYNITSHNISDDINFAGNDLETEVNKSIEVKIILDSEVVNTFNRIRLVAIQYEVYGDIPTVRIVAEQELSTNIVTFVDSGNTIGELVLEEFQIMRNNLIPATIESKNNYLFAANIKQEYFDVDELVSDYLDTRAYRWRFAETGSTVSGSDSLNDSSDPQALLDNPGTGTNSWEVTISVMNDSGWSVAIKIGAPKHAHDLGRIDCTGVSSLNSSNMVLRLHEIGVGWLSPSEGLILKLDTASFSYSPIDINTGWLYVNGTQFYDLKPSEVIPSYPGSFDIHAITDLSYTYTYTELAVGANKYECVLNKGNVGSSSEFVVDDGTTLNLAVPENHDCINTYNNILNDEDTDRGHEFKYKYGIVGDPTVATDLGGTGKYISYYFSTDSINSGSVTYVDYYGNNQPILYSSSLSPGFNNPQTVIDNTSYQHNEVYRMGISLYDLKGRESFVKWIGDIRFPDISEQLKTNTWISDYNITDYYIPDLYNIMVSKSLKIVFEINWDAINTDFPELLDQLSGFQIVRCLRTANDNTIKAQGLILPTHRPKIPGAQIKDANYSSYNITSMMDYQDLADAVQISGVTGLQSAITKDLVELISPDIAVNKSMTIDKFSDFLEVKGYLNLIQKNGVTLTVDSKTIKTYAVTSTYVTPLQVTSERLKNDWRKTIDDGIISIPETLSPPIKSIGTSPYVARGYDDTTSAANPEMTYKGTTLVIKLSGIFTNLLSGINGGEQAIWGRYRRYLGYSAYGGATYNERSYSQYIGTTSFTTIPDPSIVPLGSYEINDGDVYINPFAFLKLFVDTKSEYVDHSGQCIISFPSQSKINTGYISNNFAKYYKEAADSENYFVAENQSTGISQYPNGYPDIGNLYRYNSAYSAENTSKVFITKPFDFRDVLINDIIVTNSERKFNNEYSDSWLKFKYNNYIELEGEYGGITRLINNNEKLVAFQDRGIAVLSVMERELVETNNTTTLAVGTGGILSRYDYISKSCGTSLYDAIVPTELGIYFYDNFNGRIYRILEQLETISDTKGMKSYYDVNLFSSLITAYDRANREVLFTPDISAGENSVCFSGYIDGFTSFYTFNPEKYITFDKYTLSSLDSNKFYLHNVGNYNEYYGVAQPSYLTLIVNPMKTNICTYHIVEWNTDMTVNGVEVNPNGTFETLRITNTHQDTGIINLPNAYSVNNYLQKRFRKWRLNVFRDSTDDGRIRDAWIKAEFYWSTAGATIIDPNIKLVVHPMHFAYVPTKLY